MNLLPLPAFSDNYIWIMHDAQNAIVVDPGDADEVFDFIRDRKLTLAAILVTHHHGDHVGGVEDLHAGTGAKVYGPANEVMPEPITRVVQGDVVTALDLQFQVIEVPGHTSGHIAYFCPDLNGTPVLFCGDTLFSGGCGRLFEGTPAQMQTSLDALAALPANTRVCCAHEYTLSNLKFARAVEPSNAALLQYHKDCVALRDAGKPTLPSHLALELAINPFLRTRQAEVAKAALGFDASVNPNDAVSVLAALREWKNVFR